MIRMGGPRFEAIGSLAHDGWVLECGTCGWIGERRPKVEGVPPPKDQSVEFTFECEKCKAKATFIMEWFWPPPRLRTRHKQESDA